MKDVVDLGREAEGSLSGELNITSAETADWRSWQGFGHAKLEAGRLWDTPLFGIFSRLMNAWFLLAKHIVKVPTARASSASKIVSFERKT